MSANLLASSGETPQTHTVTQANISAAKVGHTDRAGIQLADPFVVGSENRTMHIGASLRVAADAAPRMLHLWLKYEDAVRSANWVGTYSPTLVSGEWVRVSGDLVVPSGMTVTGIGIGVYTPMQFDVCRFQLWDGPGSEATLALASDTLAWSAGVASVTRYWQLALPTAATPEAPASSSSLGSWSATEPAVDTSMVLWTCECTRYTDGTESWSQVGKSTSYEAAKDAKDAAKAAGDAANEASKKASELSTLVHSGSDGVTVGYSEDGKTFSGGRTRQSADGFEVLGPDGETLAKLAAAMIKLLGGKLTISIDETTGAEFSVDLGTSDTASFDIQSHADLTKNPVTYVKIRDDEIGMWAQGPSGFPSGFMTTEAGTQYQNPLFLMDGFAFGAARAHGPRVKVMYCGSDTPTLSGESTAWMSAADFKAKAGFDPTQSKCAIFVANGDWDAYIGAVTAGFQRSTGYWNLYASKGTAGKLVRINYMIVVWE